MHKAYFIPSLSLESPGACSCLVRDIRHLAHLKKFISVASSALFLFIASPSGTAQTVNVDFGSGHLYSGLAAAPDEGINTFWNSTSGATGSDLLASDGVTETGLGFILDPFSRFFDNSDGPQARNLLSGFDLMRDYSVGEGHFSYTLTLTGLVPSGLYDLYLYGQGDANTPGNSQTTAFTVNGITKSTAAPDDALITLVENQQYVVFRGVTADSSGEIFVSYAAGEVNGGSDFANINGFQVQAVPEPSVMLLITLGLIALVLRHKARSA